MALESGGGRAPQSIEAAEGCAGRQPRSSGREESVGRSQRPTAPHQGKDKQTRACYGGFGGVFRDLDGHAWEVAHNPGFGLNDDGSVSLPLTDS